MRGPLVVNDAISIAPSELRFTYVRSSGPGGQNVNKVNSKAVLRWRPADSAALTPEVLARLLAQCRGRINDAGELVLSSDRHRDQPRNTADCLARLRSLVAAAATPPRRRRPTRRPRAANEARLRAKREHSQKKRSRRPPSSE